MYAYNITYEGGLESKVNGWISSEWKDVLLSCYPGINVPFSHLIAPCFIDYVYSFTALFSWLWQVFFVVIAYLYFYTTFIVDVLMANRIGEKRMHCNKTYGKNKAI